MEAPKKKARKVKNKTGVEVVQAVLRTPEPQLIVNENAQPAFEQLPSYEDMMCQENVNGPSSMETQPDQAPLLITEEGITMLPEGQNVEWWSMEGELDVPNLQELALQEYLLDASKPVHSNFVLSEEKQGLYYTCPVYFGNADNKQTVLNTLCSSIHPKIQQQWGTIGCHCGLVPRLKLSQTPRNPNKVFLSCPKEREARCTYFQWIHQAPKPVRVPKACSPPVLKKRMYDMVEAKLQIEKRPKVEGGFTFP